MTRMVEISEATLVMRTAHWSGYAAGLDEAADYLESIRDEAGAALFRARAENMKSIATLINARAARARGETHVQEDAL